MNSVEIGNIGEDYVCSYLIKQGFEIVERNYRIRGGEIDIIAVNDEYIIFVEVKSRKPHSMVGGFEAVNRRKQELIIKTAQDFCLKHPNMLQPRFDTAQVIVAEGRVLSMDYIKNAFDTTGFKFIF